MSVKRNALGKGLTALLQNNATDVSGKNPVPVNSVAEISISEIEANPFQPRQEFDEAALEELMESIRIHGIIQPVTVRKMGYGKYELISGERRTRAARRLGLKTIPAYVRLANDQGMLEMALIENIHRENLNPIEIAFS
nr:ParB/RepB/Spo0J family partition protein [Bacteroidota bacterium]